MTIEHPSDRRHDRRRFLTAAGVASAGAWATPAVVTRVAAGAATSNVPDDEPPTEGELLLSATDRGWYRDNGSHGPPNTNHLTGFFANGEYRSFYVFDTAVLAGKTILAASFESPVPPVAQDLDEGGYRGGPTETFQLHEVTQPVSVVTVSGGGVAVFDDLGDGPVFGEATVSEADEGTVLQVPLNAAGVAALAGSPSEFLLGGVISTIDLTPVLPLDPGVPISPAELGVPAVPNVLGPQLVPADQSIFNGTNAGRGFAVGESILRIQFTA